MLVLEFKAKAKTTQYAAVDEAFQNKSFQQRELSQISLTNALSLILCYKLYLIMLLGKGKLKYYPLEGEANNVGWLILQCDRDLSLYYSWFVQKQLGLRLQHPRLGSHITVVRGEVVKNDFRWNAYPSQTINFYYSNEIKTNGRYWWLNVYSPCLMSIRQELGLEVKPEYDLHVTIGVWVE